jgi:hypothetical protein
MNNNDKINIINDRISRYSSLIPIIEQGIIDDPNEKPMGQSRKSFLIDLKLIINALEKEIDNLRKE